MRCFRLTPVVLYSALVCALLVTSNLYVAQLYGQQDAGAPLVAPADENGNELEYHLLITGNFGQGSLQVQTVNQFGPCAWLRDMNNNRYMLKPFDIITGVGNRPFNGRDQFISMVSLDAHRDGDVEITVTNPAAASSNNYRVRPVRVKKLPKPEVKIPDDLRASGVKIIVVGLTGDPTVGTSVATSIHRLSLLFHKSNLEELKNSILLTSPYSNNPGAILQAINSFPVESTEALLFIYLGHGAYDPNAAQTDVLCGGHYFDLGPGARLMRSDVRKALVRKGARLTVLLSDSCNVDPNNLPRVPSTLELYSQDNWAIGNLLLDHIGVVDINSASKDRFGWADPENGLWFTHVLCQVADPTEYGGKQFISWKTFFKRLSKESNSFFQERKLMPNAPPELRDQPDFFPMDFNSQVVATNNGNAGLK